MRTTGSSEDDFEDDDDFPSRFTSTFRPTPGPALREEQSRYEDDRVTRIYRHGTSSDSERSFVEVGMGGYPDGAYEYVEAVDHRN